MEKPSTVSCSDLSSSYSTGEASLLPSSASSVDSSIPHNTHGNASHDGDGHMNSDPIAIIGLALKLPGDATSVESFWDIMIKGQSTSAKVPSDRYNVDAHYCADSGSLGTVHTKKAHFLKEDLGVFDSAFFGYGEAESAAMDPQQRGLLETTYLALENAGLPMEKVSGTKTSVHMGCFSTDYMLMMARDPEEAPKYGSTGVSQAMLSNRISSFFNLKGVSVSLDTACSSSLVAIQQSCQTLQLGQSSLGIAGGCNITASLDATISLSNLGFLSPEGVCHSFDHRANGYARAEGFGVVILKRLSDALRDGDTIRAVIRASASNQAGSTPLAQPSKEAQAEMMEDAYRAAGLDPAETTYVEAHGTGTAVGDPLEARAIGQVFSVGTKRRDPVYIGSLKANFGHLEGAAGVAGFMKAVLMLERGIIPPLAGFEKVNPDIDASFLNIKFNTAPVAWPSPGLRRVSVNSFGFGGTNAHVILDDAYHYMHQRGLPGNHCTATTRPRGVSQVKSTDLLDSQRLSSSVALVWSAFDESRLNHMLSQYTDWFTKLPPQGDGFLSSLSHTLLERRSLFSWRSFAVSDPHGNMGKLQPSKPVFSRPSSELSLAFVFTGQGAQWRGMGRELLAYDIFRQSVKDASVYLANYGCGWDVKGALGGEIEDIDDAAIAQAICTILQVALIQLLTSVNVHPSVVIGHSSGEIAAAYACGAISRESAWKLAYFRGVCSSQLASSLHVRGAMVSVGLSEEEAKQHILQIIQELGCDGMLTIACINSPTNVTVSGDEEHIKALESRLTEASIFARLLKVPVAYHGPQMHEAADSYFQSIGCITTGSLGPGRQVNMISSVTGNPILKEHLLDPAYWVRNLVSPVKFMQAVQTTFSATQKKMRHKLDSSHLTEIWATDILEIGPHATLSGAIRESLKPIAKAKDVTYKPVLVREKNSCQTILNAAAHLYCRGYPVSLSKLNEEQMPSSLSNVCLPHLPSYPFDHSKSFWYESRISQDWRFRTHAKNPFLGSRVVDWNPLDARWRHYINVSDSWIADHRIGSRVLFPAAGMLVMALEGASQLSSHHAICAYEFKDITFSAALELRPESGSIEVQLQMLPRKSTTTKEGTEYAFCLTARNPEWTEICGGSIRRIARVMHRNEVDQHDEESYVSQRVMSLYKDISRSCGSQKVDRSEAYALFKTLGYNYGPMFKRMQTLRYSGREAVGEIELAPVEEYERPTVIHPATLDAIFHPTIAAMMHEARYSDMSATAVPTRIDRLWISTTGLADSSNPDLKVAAQTKIPGPRITKSNIATLSHNRALKIYVEGLEGTVVNGPDMSPPACRPAQRLCWDIVYKPDVTTLTSAQLHQYLWAGASENLLSPQFFAELDLMSVNNLKDSLLSVPEASEVVNVAHIHHYFQWMVKKIGTESDRDYQDPTSELLHLETEMGRKASDVFRLVGKNLVGILKGVVDPLGLLFQGDQMDEFHDILVETANYNRPISRYLDLLTHKIPSMNFLEVGAGTGGMSRRILHTISQPGTNGRSSRYANYYFTDISSSFFEKAKENLQEFPKVHYKPLDIEVDPTAQGFEAESFDVVVVSLVLHATKSLDRSVSNIQRLLKPGGKLIITEILYPDSIRAGFVFGILPGWWLSEENYRQERLSPCIEEHEWDRLLKSNGFSGCDLVLHDQEDEQLRTTSVIVTKKLDFDSLPSPSEVNSASLICPSDGEEVLILACHEHLERHGIRPRRITFGDATTPYLFPADELVIVCDSGERSFIERLDETNFVPFRQTLVGATHVLWITSTYKETPNKPSRSAIYGLSRAIRAEHQLLNFTLLELTTPSDLGGPEANLAKVFQQCFSPSSAQPFEEEYREEEGILRLPRVVEDPHLNSIVAEDAMSLLQREVPYGSTNLRLSVQTPGLLDSLIFAEAPPPPETLHPREIEISVHAVGMNFRDCLGALGRIPDDNFGSECAGIVEKIGPFCESGLQPGDRVTVLAPCGFSSSIRCSEKCAIKIPDDLPFTEAAKIPTNFGTAYWALVEVGRIRKGETVLIHAGAGGTGQAAIQIAQHFGAEVFVTVGSQEKRSLVMSLYDIPADHIFYSRDVSFAEGVMSYTEGRGVDIILNSLAGEGLRASWECIAPFGRFLEIGKRDIYQHEHMSMFPFARNVTFSAIDLADFEERIDRLRATLETVVKLVGDKKLRIASPLQVFSVRQIEAGFRYLQSGKHAGAVVIETDPNMIVQALVAPPHRCIFRPDATYVIAGGFGGQGMSIARWMSENGARNLLLLSRQGRKASGAEECMRELAEAGVHVEAPPTDIASVESLRCALQTATTSGMPTVRGCIQAAMVVRDFLFSDMDYSNWAASTSPKVAGTWNLHTLLPSCMDFFILLSSIGGIIGSSGQSNYASGNTYLDAFAAHRLSMGQKTVSLNLSAMAEAGFFVGKKKMLDMLINTKQVVPMSQAQLFAVLRYYCNPELSIKDVRSQLVMGLTLPIDIKRAGHDMAYLYRANLSHLHQLDSLDSASTSTSTSSSESAGHLDLAALRACKSQAEAARIVATALQAKLSKVFSGIVDDVDVTQPLHTFGVDSLVAVELRNWFLKNLRVDIPVFEILGGATIEGLGMAVAEKIEI